MPALLDEQGASTLTKLSTHFHAMALSAQETALRARIDARAGNGLRLLEQLVRINSGSGNLPGIEAVGDLVKPAFDDLGFTTRWHLPAKGHGRERAARSLVARRKGGSGATPVFITAHLDTVFEPEDGFEGFRVEADRAIGPGVVDCKGGVIAILAALDALASEGMLDRVDCRVVLGGDEETGSFESREIIQQEAAGSAYSLVFEGGRPSGDIVRYRAGNGGFDVTAIGKAAHAGNAHAEGVNAIEVLSAAVLALQKLTDYSRGITVNVGTIRGGAKRNIVPGDALATVDVRYAHAADGPAFEAAVRDVEKVAAAYKGTLRITGGLNRPPYPDASKPIGELAERWIAAAAELGVAMKAGPTGGGSDGNWTAAMGIPTLDGLGPVGGKYHTFGEYLIVKTLPERAAVAAVGIARLAQ